MVMLVHQHHLIIDHHSATGLTVRLTVHRRAEAISGRKGGRPSGLLRRIRCMSG